MTGFDYVVVGGGSAGCVLAARLSEDPAARVCLIEAGPSDDSALVTTPVGAALLVPTRIRNWAFETVPQEALYQRRGYQPRGRMLGGSSSINAMIYLRGHRLDYDDWAAGGATGWSYDEVLPYFKRSEDNDRGADVFHAVGGPLSIYPPSPRQSRVRRYEQDPEPFLACRPSWLDVASADQQSGYRFGHKLDFHSGFRQ